MLMSIRELKWRWQLAPISVLHVGAHLAEESDLYRAAGWNNVTWIEANPEVVRDLRRKVQPMGHQVIEAAVWHSDDELLSFSVASNGQSSSLLEFREHSSLCPEIVVEKKLMMRTSRVETLLSDNDPPDFCNLDIQGAELSALQGFGTILGGVQAIYTEVNKAELYEGCARIDEMDVFLGEAGFRRVATRWVLGFGWGDALYLRQSPSLVRRALGVYWPLGFYARQLPAPVIQLLRKWARRVLKK